MQASSIACGVGSDAASDSGVMGATGLRVSAVLPVLFGYRLRVPDTIDGGSALPVEDDGDWDAHKDADSSDCRSDERTQDHDGEPDRARDDDCSWDRWRVSDVFALFYFFSPAVLLARLVVRPSWSHRPNATPITSGAATRISGDAQVVL